MSHSQEAVGASARDPGDDGWSALLHRWFVHYNPLYLASAMLVLVGLTLVSRGLVEHGSKASLLWVALLAEVYAWSLVGGAALLVRVGQRRPAVWLALLAFVYQMDLTLHTQTCAALGVVGVAPAALWLASFVGKLATLARAMRVRVAPRALATATLAATGLAVLPFTFYRLDPATIGHLLAGLVLGLGACLPRQLAASTTSLDPLDAWGQTVLRRVNRAAWGIGGALLAMHLAFWSVETSCGLGRPAIALVALVAARRLDERGLWVVVAGSLGLVALVGPAHLAALSLLWTLALTLRAFSVRSVAPAGHAAAPATEPAYRGAHDAPGGTTAPDAQLVTVSPAERRRLLTGALATGYAALWMHGWHGGALPAHVWMIDLTVVAAGLLMAWRLGARLVLVVLATVLGHATTSAGLVPAPRSLVEWGAASLVLGFAMLFAGLAVTYRLRAPGPGR